MYFGGVKVVCAVQCGLWNMDAKMDLSQDLTMWHLHTIKYWAQCPVWNVWCREVLQCPVLCAAVALFTLHSVAESKKRWLLTGPPLQRGTRTLPPFKKTQKKNWRSDQTQKGHSCRVASTLTVRVYSEKGGNCGEVQRAFSIGNDKTGTSRLRNEH